MTTRTERADEIFWFIILFVVTAILYFLAYMLFATNKPMYGYFMTAFALLGTLFTIFGIRTILIHRWAEQRMREWRKKEENRWRAIIRR